jgi:hypothetical protein
MRNPISSVLPADRDAFKKRGKFFASTFAQAEFYGRPNDEPERVNIGNPVYGFSEMEILEKLFTSEQIAKFGLNDMENGTSPAWYEKRMALDHKMYLRAKKLGYDAIESWSGKTGQWHKWWRCSILTTL